MKTRVDQNPSTKSESASQSTPTPKSMPTSGYKLSKPLWEALNFLFVTGVTCGGVVIFQSPLKTVLTNLTIDGTVLPKYPLTSIGTFGFFRALYAGTSASFAGSAARTAYVTAAKNNKPIEVKESTPHEEKLSGLNLNKAGYVMSAAFGDYVVTQIPKSLSQLRKIPNLLPSGFKWYTRNNLYQLWTGGFPSEYFAGLANFGALCVLEEELAKRLPIEDEKIRHLLSGALTGVGAGVISYPFALLRDYTLVHANVTNGQLRIDSTATILKKLAAAYLENPKEAGLAFLANAAKQVPIRAILTGGVFSIVASVGATLGSAPLSKIIPERFHPSKTNPQGFFYNRKTTGDGETPSSQQQEVESPSPTPKQ
ncbi:hypothetical protein [Legionella micdadei]|uniref:hypothetical protein n=1 Tax=Legionella micdadei TaxID=451 RepID=UPI0009EF7F6D|nr:hypothetical protein [Legionella micdadei]ARH00428.1 hypothetical protein B6V88_08325 [Legionella micdadei]